MCWCNLFQCLVRELQVFFQRYRIGNLHEYQGSSDQKRPKKKSPVRREFIHEGCFEGIGAGCYCIASRLNPFVEAGKVGQFTSIVRPKRPSAYAEQLALAPKNAREDHPYQ